MLVEGKARARVKQVRQSEPHFTAEIAVIEEEEPETGEVEALVRSVHATFENYVKLNKKVPAEVLGNVQQIQEPASSPTPSRRT